MTGKRLLTIGGLLLAAVLLVATNMVSNAALRSSRIDLTEDKLFTLSEGTVKTLATLDEPITLRFYLSRSLATRLPGISSYASRVEELLEEYQRQADGQITLLKIDPEPFSDEEDRAVGYGLRGVPVDESETTFYFGLVGTGSTGQEQVIPFFSSSREKFLEYDLSRLIHTLANPRQPVVGLLSTLPINGAGPRQMMQGLGAPPWMVAEQMRELFEIAPLDQDVDRIPDDIDVLMLVHPKALPERTQYAIDQFVMGGGRALVFVDPHAEADPGAAQPGMMGMVPQGSKTSNPERLLASWGLKLASDKVVADISAATRVRAERNGRLITLDYPVWMNLDSDALNDADTVSANIDKLTLASAGQLEPVPAAGTTVTPLIRSSTDAALLDLAMVQSFADPQALLRDYRAGGERLTLAARVTGSARSAFQNGPPAAEDSDAPSSSTDAPAATRAHLESSIGPINVIVIADVDMLHDRFWVQVQDLLGSRIAIPTAANGPFVINALDNLTGSSALIEIRGRGGFIKPFGRVDAMRQQAELAFREKEQELIQRLEQTEQRLTELESQKQGEDALVLSDAQRRELVSFRQQRLEIRKELREVRRRLRASIEQLEGWLTFVNVALVPLLIGLGGLLVAALRMRRRRLSLRAAG